MITRSPGAGASHIDLTAFEHVASLTSVPFVEQPRTPLGAERERGRQSEAPPWAGVGRGPTLGKGSL
jgi:hypothetical protein